jgi:hypothetical protein
MKQFRDNKGRTWDIAGSLGAWERVKLNAGVDMTTLATTRECLTQLADAFTLGHVLYQLCAEQCEARGVSPEEFANGFDADVLNESLNALVKEAIFFCRKQIQPALMRLWNRAVEADREVVAQVAKQVDMASRQIEQEVASLLTSTNCATSSEESSESTPVHGRSAGSPGRRKQGKKTHGITQRTC